jgi:hypothetical protein
VGAKLFEAIQTCGTTDTGRGWLFLLSGHDVERWMLRSLAIFGVSGNFAIDGALIDQNFVDRLQIVELLEALLRHQRVPRGDGFGGFGVDGFRLYGLPFEPCTVAILDRRTGPADLAIETFVAHPAEATLDIRRWRDRISQVVVAWNGRGVQNPLPWNNLLSVPNTVMREHQSKPQPVAQSRDGAPIGRFRPRRINRPSRIRLGAEAGKPLIQSASYPRSASNIVCGSNALRRNRTQPIVVCLTGREGEMDRQAVAVHDRVNLGRQAPSRVPHIFMIVVRDTGSELVHTYDRRVDHLYRRGMTGGQRIHDADRDASLTPTNKAIITSGARTIGLRHRAREHLSEHHRPGTEFGPSVRNCIVA